MTFSIWYIGVHMLELKIILKCNDKLLIKIVIAVISALVVKVIIGI